jgi:hypothetical protein
MNAWNCKQELGSVICITLIYIYTLIYRHIHRTLWKPVTANFTRKGKAIPVTGRGGPQGCETSRLPHFLDNRLTDGGEIVSLTRRPLFTPPPPQRFLTLIFVRD